MKYYIIILFSFLILIGCEPKLTSKNVNTQYYDVGMLINNAVSTFNTYPVTVTKQLEIDGKQEEKTLSLTKEQFLEEVDMLQLLDINQSGLVGAYSETISENTTTYQLKEKETQTGIIDLTIEEKGTVKRVSGNFIEENSLYYSARKFHLIIENNLLKSYRITGTQKMMFKDTVSFSINLAIKN